ncbi:MAG: hypothetical protein K8R67_18680 [Desulfobacteraceae bacterium]|nr:hypothetical protein [Desulfobacteraceae bacterium]
MEKKTLYKIASIGCLHIFLYLYLIPFIIVPTFGNSGLKMAIAIAIGISMIIIVTIFIEKSNRSNKDEKN